MSQQYSDLEVAPDVTTPEPYYEEKIAHNNAALPKPELDVEHASQSRRRCGLSPRAFWLALCGLLLVVAGAIVGGAVGGIQAARSRNSNSDDNTSSTHVGSTASFASRPSTEATSIASSATSIASSATSIASSTTARGLPSKTVTLVGPTQTLYRDCPSSNNTVYDALSSTDFQFRKICNAAFRWSGGNVVNEKTSSLNDCIDLCVAFNVRNRTEIAAGRSNVCNGVCWRNNINDPDWPGQCFGATIQNSSDTGFPFSGEAICDSGAWINQHLL